MGQIAKSLSLGAKAAVKILYYRIFLRSPRAQSEKSEIEFETFFTLPVQS